MRNIANYDVTAACGYVGCPLNGFKNPLAPLTNAFGCIMNSILILKFYNIDYN